jgi:uncharacterized protein (DUF4415 family)
MRKRKPLTDEEGEVRELLLEDMKRFRPIAEVLPPSSLQKLGLKRRTEQVTQDKEKVTLQLSRDVVEKFRATGEGWEARVDAALREWAVAHFSK